MAHTEVSVWRGLTLAYRPSSVDEQVIKETIVDDIFFKGMPEYTPGRGDVIIDVGAHIGTFALWATRRVPLARVFAIEPSSESFGILRRNVELNQPLAISLHQMALYDRNGKIKLFHDVEHGNWGHSVVKNFAESGEMVTCDTLESFLKSNQVNECDLLKLNCEGAEFAILLATPKLVLQKIKSILVLYHCDLEERFRLDQLTDHLKEAGFILTTRFVFGDRGWLIGHRNRWLHLKLKVKSMLKKVLFTILNRQ